MYHLLEVKQCITYWRLNNVSPIGGYTKYHLFEVKQKYSLLEVKQRMTYLRLNKSITYWRLNKVSPIGG